MKSHVLSTGITPERRQLEASLLAMMHAVRDSYRAWCEECCDVVNALTPESAVTLLRVTPASLCLLLETGKWHVVEVGGKAGLICCKSISTNSHNLGALG